MVEDVFKVVNVPSVKALIDGNIIKFQRPFKSTKVDIVVNAITLDPEAYQFGSLNINIHAPNLITQFNGITDNNQPNLPKFKEVWEAIKPLLSINNFDNFSIYPEPMQPILDTDGNWFATIKIEYHSFNEQFKN